MANKANLSQIKKVAMCEAANNLPLSVWAREEEVRKSSYLLKVIYFYFLIKFRWQPSSCMPLRQGSTRWDQTEACHGNESERNSFCGPPRRRHFRGYFQGRKKVFTPMVHTYNRGTSVWTCYLGLSCCAVLRHGESTGFHFSLKKSFFNEVT